MSFIGKPVHVCREHVKPRICGCLGIELSDLKSLRASTPDNRGCCAACGLYGGELVTVRKCLKARCFYLYTKQ